MLVPYEELHFRDLLVHLLHKLNDEINQLMLQHLLCMEVGNQERDVISLDRFPSQNVERLRSLGQEPCKLVDQDVLNFVGLLDLDAYPHAVDTGLNVHSLVLVSRHGERVQDDFRGAGGLDLGDIVSLRGLRGEVGQGERGRER